MAAIVLAVSAVPFLRRKIYFTGDGTLSRLKIIAVPAGIVGLFLLFRVVFPGIQQAVRVSPDELKAELPYIEHNMSFTRSAYSIGSNC